MEGDHLPAALNQRVARLRVKNQTQITDPYLFYFLSSEIFKKILASLSRGVAQQNVSPKAIGEIKIPTPPFPEQQRIATILDETFTVIDAVFANTEENLANARILFDSYLNKVFTQKGDGWKTEELGYLVDIKHDFSFKSEYFRSQGDFVLLTPGNFYKEGGYRNRGEKQNFIPEKFQMGFC